MLVLNAIALIFTGLGAFAQPKVTAKILTPIHSPSQVRSCREVFTKFPHMGVAGIEFGKPIGTTGRYVEQRQTATYMIGGFGMFNHGRTVVDNYNAGFKWTPHYYEVVSEKAPPKDYVNVINDFFEFWRTQKLDPEHVQELESMEHQYDWRRTTFLTYSIEGTYIGGAKVYDGHKSINVFQKSGLIKEGLSLGDTKVLLPMEQRYPEVRIEGRKIELGLLTSRTEIDNSMQALFFQGAKHIAMMYGKGEVELVDTRIPLWMESPETGLVNIGGMNTVAQVHRSTAPGYREGTLKYYRKAPHREDSMKAMEDLYIYFIASPRITKFHQRNIKGVEIVDTITTIGGERNILRVRGDLFVDQFYFSNEAAKPELNERAKDLDAYRQADIRRRWQAVKEARYNRILRERKLEILRESYGEEGTLENYDVIIRGDFMDPNAPLEVQIVPKAWHIKQRYYDDSLMQNMDDYF